MQGRLDDILKNAKLSKECLEHLKKKFEKIEEELKTQALHAEGESQLREIQSIYKAVKRLENLLNLDITKARSVKNG